MSTSGNGPTVAKAYVSIIPSMVGAQKTISSALIPISEKVGDAAGITSGEHMSGGLANALHSATGKLTTIVTRAIAAAGIGKIFKDMVSSYSQWEQMEGGVRAIFGVDGSQEAANIVIKNAQNAFKTAQVSANKYMETVTGFSSRLIQSVGGDTVTAAKLADQAMVDMADNYNRFGTSMSSLTAAYEGFARGQYTMLDNLKIGYGGSATEMARLINESGVLGDTLINLEDTQNVGKVLQRVGFDKMIEAIHIVQDRIGVAGTAADEAVKTIQGSFNRLKASWENLLLAFGKGSTEEIGISIQQFGESLSIFLGNLIPRIGIILSGVLKSLPMLVKGIAEGATTLGKTFVTKFQEAVSVSDFALRINRLLQAFLNSGILDALTNFKARVVSAWGQIVNSIGIAQWSQSFTGAFAKAFLALESHIHSLGELLTNFINSIDLSGITADISNLISSIPKDALITITDLILNKISSITHDLQVLSGIASLLWENILYPAFSGIVDLIISHVLPAIGKISTSFTKLSVKTRTAFSVITKNIDITPVLESISSAIQAVIGLVSDAVDSVGTFVSDFIDSFSMLEIYDFMKVLGRLIQGVGNTIISILRIIWPLITNIANLLFTAIGPGVQSLLILLEPLFRNLLNAIAAVFEWIGKIDGMLADWLIPRTELFFAALNPMFAGLLDGINHVVAGISEAIEMIWNRLEPFVTKITDALAPIFTALGKFLSAHKQQLTDIGNIIGAIFSVIGIGIEVLLITVALIIDLFIDIIDFVVTTLGDTITFITAIVTGHTMIAWNALANLYKHIAETFSNIMKDLWSFVQSIGKLIPVEVYPIIERLFNMVLSFYRFIIDSVRHMGSAIVNAFKLAFLLVKYWWNSTIGGFSFSIPAWMPLVGGRTFRIPYLATGGDITTAGTVVVGEAGPELLSLPRGARVTPLSDATTPSGNTYSVIVGDVDLTDDDQVRRVTREYLEFLARLASPSSMVIA